MAIWKSSKWAVSKHDFLLSSLIFSLYCLQETFVFAGIGCELTQLSCVHPLHLCGFFHLSHMHSFVSHLMVWPLVNGCYYAVFHCIGYEVHWRRIGGKWCFYANIPLLCIQFFSGGREEEGGGNLLWQVKTCFYFMDCDGNHSYLLLKKWTARNIIILNCQMVCYDTVAFILFNTIICFPITGIHLCIDVSQIFVL